MLMSDGWLDNEIEDDKDDWRDLMPIWEQPWAGDVNLHLVEEWKNENADV